MHISVQTLLEELNYNYEIHCTHVEKKKYEWVKLLTDENTVREENYIYTGRLSQVLELKSRGSDQCFICLRDRLPDSRESEEALQGLIIINENVKLEELFECLQGVFLKLERWIYALQESVIHKRGMQDLLDLSETVILNHICILDPTFKLLAYTKNIECTEENVVNIISRGYHTDEVIQKLEKARHIEYYRHSEDILVDKTFDVAKFYVAEKAFIYKNDFSVQVVMTGCQSDLTQAQLELFEILLSYIQIYVDEEYRSEGQNNSYTSFLKELLENKRKIDEQAIARRAANSKLAYKGNFVTFCISFGDSENVPYHYVLKKVVDLLPESKILVFQQDIVCLNKFDRNPLEQSEKAVKLLQPVLNQYCAECGVSSPFFRLHELYRSYRQARLAIKYGKVSVGTGRRDQDEKPAGISFFEACWRNFVVGAIFEQNAFVLQNTECIKSLYRLYRNDQSYNTEYMKILYCYLQNDRSPSKAAEELHMHRNNVVYHINKITELLSVDLNVPDERLNLMIAYQLFRYGEYVRRQEENELTVAVPSVQEIT